MKRLSTQATASANRARSLVQADYDRNLKQVNEETDKAMKALDDTRDEMLREWNVTKRPPRQAAFVHAALK